MYDDTPDNLEGGKNALVNFRIDDNGQGEDTFGMARQIDVGTEAKSSEQQPVDLSKYPIVFTDGVIVEPKRGRLVLFTGGAENFHSPTAATKGNAD